MEQAQKVTENDLSGNWSSSYSLWTYYLNLSCCGLEFQSALGPRYDWERFGATIVDDPINADLLIVDGPVNEYSKKIILSAYESMNTPKYVISMGSCANSGGMYLTDESSLVRGVDTIIPVDLFVPGCPPRPEAMINALITIQNMIRAKTVSQ